MFCMISFCFSAPDAYITPACTNGIGFTEIGERAAKITEQRIIGFCFFRFLFFAADLICVRFHRNRFNTNGMVFRIMNSKQVRCKVRMSKTLEPKVLETFRAFLSEWIQRRRISSNGAEIHFEIHHSLFDIRYSIQFLVVPGSSFELIFLLRFPQFCILRENITCGKFAENESPHSVEKSKLQ